jgi:ABC-type microcin C transport system permease subunit YejB
MAAAIAAQQALVLVVALGVLGNKVPVVVDLAPMGCMEQAVAELAAETQRLAVDSK